MYLVVTNDDAESVAFTTSYISELARWLGKTEGNIRATLSLHTRDKYSRWYGDYKILKVED